VDRVDADTQIDLSGYWNDTDLRLASDNLIQAALATPRLNTFDTTRGRLPVIIVGNFRNASDEHIDTSILSQRLEASILNSGKAEFVASGDLRSEIRAERNDQQQGYTSDATMAALGREVGADFMMTGSVKTIVDSYNKTATRSYFITAELTDITTNRRVWIGEYNEIKKVIKKPAVKP
jgi:PBP1b-binding outer membrane lipoprotein LpoB